MVLQITFPYGSRRLACKNPRISKRSFDPALGISRSTCQRRNASTVGLLNEVNPRLRRFKVHLRELMWSQENRERSRNGGGCVSGKYLLQCLSRVLGPDS